MAKRTAFDESLLDMPEVTGHDHHARSRDRVLAASHAQPAPARASWGGEDLSGQWWVVSRSRQGF
ncbi:MAG: hypothetical protein H6740_13955 [Alphaproteobacteria bacterium]|nr:hypothetical protein [Alphaproteobacteria bacterium]